MLGAGLAAGLTAAGWAPVRLVTPERLAEAVDGEARGARPARMVLVADGPGGLPDPRAVLPRLPDPLVVAVGGRPALAALADAVEGRAAAAALDADQPFIDLVAALDGVLRRATDIAVRADLVAGLRARAREAALFAALTPREQEVLGGMLAGRSAAEIAAGQQVSLATVRSHIRAVLAKLGVSSQLAAVALAHRSAHEPRIVELLSRVHQF